MKHCVNIRIQTRRVTQCIPMRQIDEKKERVSLTFHKISDRWIAAAVSLIFYYIPTSLISELSLSVVVSTVAWMQFELEMKASFDERTRVEDGQVYRSRVRGGDRLNLSRS